MAFYAARTLPSGVRGPVERCALRRLASIRFFDDIMGFLWVASRLGGSEESALQGHGAWGDVAVLQALEGSAGAVDGFDGGVVGGGVFH